MVASDTVVGLVGAGILLVALVGVFVYESQQSTDTSATLEAGAYEVATNGAANNRAATGTPVGNQCVPPAGQTSCQTAQTSIDLTLDGLPDPRDHRYVVFADGTFVVALTKSGNSTYSTGGAKTIPSMKSSFVVTLESSATPTAPSGPKVYEKTGLTSAPTNLKGNFTYRFLPSTTTATVDYKAEGGNTNATVTINGAPAQGNLVYRAWMVRDNPDGKTFDHVGNGTKVGDAIVVNGLAAGASSSYSYLIVTLEGSFNEAMPTGPEIARTR